MANAGVQNKQTAETSSVAWAMWDPFWFMRQMLGWVRSAGAPSFEVKETADAYVCKVNAKLALPDRADAAHVRAELDHGELTLLVPKAAAAKPEPEGKSASPPAKNSRTAGSNRRGSAGRTRGRRARTPARRG